MDSFNRRRSLLQEKTDYLAQVIDKIGHKFKNKEMFTSNEVYLILYNRLMSNMYSISLLFKEYQDQPLSNSISLLYRSCISDVLIGFYLLTFQKDPQTMLNEIKVLDAGFLKYIKAVLPMEQEALSKNEKEFQERIVELENEVKKIFEDLIHDQDEYKILNPKSIREKYQSNRLLFSEMQFKSNLSEENMFKHLISKMKPVFVSLYVYWRFFSQFQHFTHAGKQMNYISKSDFMNYFLHTLIICYEFVIIVNKEILNIEVSELSSHKEQLLLEYRNNKNPDLSEDKSGI